MSLKTIPLTRDGPKVAAMGVGLMSLGGAYGAGGSDETRLAFLDGLHAMGETFWDNADIYGDAEALTGKWFAVNPEKRKDIFLATKFGFVDPDFSKPLVIRSDPEYIEMALAKSLEKLQTDYVDLYYCHRVDDKTPIELTIHKLAELKKQGKIRHIGLSEVTLNDLKRAHAVHPISAVQTEYSPWYPTQYTPYPLPQFF
jgi:aryl-alcohol dehydrogenase-like predicted oxidoreductase